MQFKEWLSRNLITGLQIARTWKMNQGALSLQLNGRRVPSLKLVLRSYLISGGEVDLPDWAETCGPALVRQGILTEEEIRSVIASKARYQVRGRKPPKAKRPAPRRKEQAESRVV